MAKHEKSSKDKSAAAAVNATKHDRKRKHSVKDSDEVTPKKQRVEEVDASSVDGQKTASGNLEEKKSKQSKKSSGKNEKGDVKKEKKSSKSKRSKRDRSEEVDDGDEDTDTNPSEPNKLSSASAHLSNNAAKDLETLDISPAEQKEAEEQLKQPQERLAEKRRKRAERTKTRQPTATVSKPATTSSEEHPVLSYLTTYHMSRPTWKYQKNQETQVLKHALNIERIPPAYNTSLRVYLDGIKSEAAKRRVAEAAQKAIESSKEELSDQPWAEEFEKGVEKFKSKLTETKGMSATEYKAGWDSVSVDLNRLQTKKFDARKRAELVLFCVAGALPKPVEPKAPAKKRKNRTAVVDISSSSSSSDSSSDSSSSSSEEEEEEHKPRPILKQAGTKKHLSSSSSSSSSTSSSSSSSTSSSSSSDTSDGDENDEDD
ncbi:hypothetical protein AAP_02434 [Ascosphaera apis ARSEF 7405]|uniref:WKF domain-containing protein n=1 Tax=Ascosphaera apis ARSEF 7405 TaxID=392613 RepID=A0A168A9G5_9EURO|nr:hypothetical protein AAP_02434 [Ascosphaera apis ARSEF 7405]